MTIFKAISNLVSRIYKKNSLEKIPDCEDLTHVKNYFGLEDNQDALLAAYFINRFIEEDFNWLIITDICRDLDLTVIQAYDCVPSLDRLLQKGIFGLRNGVKYALGTVNRCTQFTITNELIDHLSGNRPFSEYKPSYEDFKFDVPNFFSEVNRINVNYFKSTALLVSFIEPYLKDPWIYELVKVLTNTNPDFSDKKNSPDDVSANDKDASCDEDVIVVAREDRFSNTSSGLLVRSTTAFRFFIGVVKALDESRQVSVKEVGDCAGLTNSAIMNCLRSIKNETNSLLTHGYIEIDKTSIADNIQLKWGEKVREAFKECPELILVEAKSKELNKITCKEIEKKELFYNEENQKDIDRLESIMKESNYKSLRKRLKEKKLPIGLTILLHGAPGTGKTETVLQLAKKTGRDVYHLNIEQVKSCWVGESEKNIKNIFKAYYASKSDKKPILLFNEADAIISKRTSVDGVNAAVVKMENAIQNLLLEELEKFDGIFIATTNLTENIDEAFDRRLLFKLKFENPTPKVKAKIWKSKLNFIDDEVAHDLSVQFDLSGGQIDNVFRKSEIDYILYGKKPSKDDLIDFCRKEKLSGGPSQSIGFH